MIVLNFIGGGLGNQMFQYAYARMLAQHYQQPLILNPYNFKNEKIRNYALEPFNLNEEVKVLTFPTTIYYAYRFKIKRRYLHKYKYKISLAGEKSFELMSRNGCYYTSSAYTYYSFYESMCRIKFVEGLFQSYKFFENISETIKSELKVNKNPSLENQKMIDKIKLNNAVCVHFRRGDYLDKQWADRLQICSLNYYYKAMDIVASKVLKPLFFIFSNSSEDIAWIKAECNFQYEVEYVDLHNPDYEELRLMYTCSHFIISNSSFSWWAQYLSDNNEKVVVAPSKWIRDKEDDSDIYMDFWDTVDVGE